jgi:heat shock protein HslJ
MTKTTLAASLFAVLLAACTAPPASQEAQATQPSATQTGSDTPPAQSAVALSGYYWRLSSAVDGKGQPIATLQPGTDPKRPLQLTFANGRLNISGGCNRLFGSYTESQGAIEVGEKIGSTMMACMDSPLMLLDSEISARLKGKLQATTSDNAEAPQLILVSGNGDKLAFNGEPTPETRYGGEGKIEFFEVAAKRVPCSHPLIPNHQCLQVRQREYEENGVQKPAKADWQPLYEDIQGYEHIDGQRDVVRVKRFERKNPPADASSVVYVLDMVVESEAPDTKK